MGAWVDEARKFGFTMQLNEDRMREVLNSERVAALVADTALDVREHAERHARALTGPRSADNYAAALFAEDSRASHYGIRFDGPYELGDRPASIVGIESTGARGSRKSAKASPDGRPPLLVEAHTHALTSHPGFIAGTPGEDIR